MARKLRIAVSVFFAVLTLALCVLWARSYSVVWGKHKNDGVTSVVAVTVGKLRVFSSEWFVMAALWPGHAWKFVKEPIDNLRCGALLHRAGA
jgi:hypothetical protein